MIKRILEYWRFSLTVLVGVVALIIEFGFSQSSAARWIVTIYALGISLFLIADMIRTLRNGRYGVDILAISAIVATILVGEYWASLLIVVMLTGGETLEDYAAGRAKRELSALLDRAPQIAHIWRDKKLVDVPVTDIKPGDKILVRPSEVIPVDGTLIDGAASFDESSLTGESMPVDRKAGEDVMSGSVNGDSAVTIRATTTSANSQYQKIIALVREAESQPAPFVRLADRYAVPFTIIAYMIAGVAWAISGDAARFAEVLVVASPCPLILAAPIALISGMSRASKHGVIVKNGTTLEKLAKIKSVAFDKTGTLTHGAVEVDAINPGAGFSKNQLLQFAASAEQSSAHILATSLVAYAKKHGVDIISAKNVEERTGDGVLASVRGKKVLVGKMQFLADSGIEAVTVNSNETIVAVAIDGIFAGTISFSDRVRDNAQDVVSGLHALGIKNVMMLTGDNAFVAKNIAARIGIDHYHAECLPADKVDLIQSESMPRPIAFVGDGVNDAPVLATADVGIAMGARGSTAASESADVVIMLDNLDRVTTVFAIAKRTLMIALQSVWVGIIICIILMLIASFGVIPALVGAALQEVVDVIVIFNALRAHGRGKRSSATKHGFRLNA